MESHKSTGMQTLQHFEDVDPFPMTNHHREKQPLNEVDDSDGDTETNRKRSLVGAPVAVVFESPSKYDWVVWAVLSVAFLSFLFPLYTIFVDDSIPTPDKKRAISTLLWTLVALFLVFALVLPTSLQVRSDGSIGVRTIFDVTWSFGNVRAAEIEHSLCSKRSCRHPRLKFATTFTSDRVLVQRQKGRWDVLVSPRDVDGFVKAVRSVVVPSTS